MDVGGNARHRIVPSDSLGCCAVPGAGQVESRNVGAFRSVAARDNSEQVIVDVIIAGVDERTPHPSPTSGNARIRLPVSRQ